MLDLNPDELPITRNRFYTNISEEEFFTEAKKMNFYTLDDLQPNSHVVLFRAAKLESGEVVFQKIEARIKSVANQIEAITNCFTWQIKSVQHG